MQPRCIACYWLTLPHLRPPTRDALLDAYRAAKDRSLWQTLPYRAGVRPRPGQCWLNVQKAIKKWGGSMVCGWHLTEDEIEDIAAKNRLGKVQAIPHGVWQTGTTLLEVSKDCVGGSFVPSSLDLSYMGLNVGFVDTLEMAQTYRPSNPFVPWHSGYLEIGKETTV